MRIYETLCSKIKFVNNKLGQFLRAKITTTELFVAFAQNTSFKYSLKETEKLTFKVQKVRKVLEAQK